MPLPLEQEQQLEQTREQPLEQPLELAKAPPRPAALVGKVTRHALAPVEFGLASEVEVEVVVGGGGGTTLAPVMSVEKAVLGCVAPCLSSELGNWRWDREARHTGEAVGIF